VALSKSACAHVWLQNVKLFLREALAANRQRWSSFEPHSPSVELLANNPVLLARVIDDLQLTSVHPPADGDQHEPEWTQDSRHLVSSFSRTLKTAEMNQRHFKQIPFPDHTGV
jgi:hypothetical protein